MHEQSKMIPRFWIDDVYFTGLLLYGFEKEVKWFEFESNSIKWSYYDFWDLDNKLTIYEVYSYVLRLFNIHPIDYYINNHFVILHLQKNNQEVNYNTFNLFKEINRTKLLDDAKELIARPNQTNLTCILENNSKISSCLHFDDINVNLFYYHFYNFCLNFWKRKF